MRLAELEVEGFRGLPAPARFDLDADAVLVVGVNGAGKTSLLDAVLWALTGRLPRIEEAGGDVRSGWAQTGETRVAVTLANAKERVRVVRSILPDEKVSRLTVETPADRHRSVAAEAALLRTVWPAGLEASDASEAMTSALTRSVYLQQDLVRQFVEADSDRDRFDVLSELVGTGRVGELHIQLEQAKRAWTAATNVLGQDVEPLGARLERLNAQLQQPTHPDSSEFEADWTAWWHDARSVGVQGPTPKATAGSSAPDLERALRELDAIARSAGRRLATLEDLAARPALSPSPLQREALVNAGRAAVAAFETARRELEEARSRATERAKLREAEHDRDRQLAELARLALAHLGERCPVCTQEYDHELTVSHLNELIAKRDADVEREDSLADSDLPKLAALVSERQAAAADASAALQAHDAATARNVALTAERQRLLHDLGLDVSTDPAGIAAVVEQTRGLVQRVDQMRAAGDRLALAVARRAQESRRTELTREAREIEARLAGMHRELDERNLTGDLAQRLLEAVRAAAADVVGLQLRHLEPLLVRLYARIDPHPALREVSLRSWTERGRGRLRAELADPSGAFSTEYPATVLSSSQLNAFAVALFLSLNLGVSRVPLRTAILDDPLQSLDDVNLLGLVDLLRRVRQRRQLVITTHDPRFGELLERKLRALEGERTVRIDLAGWSRSGPVVTQHDVPPEPKQLQLVA